MGAKPERIADLKRALLEISEELGKNERINDSVRVQLKKECRTLSGGINIFCNTVCVTGYEKDRCKSCPLNLSEVSRDKLLR